MAEPKSNQFTQEEVQSIIKQVLDEVIGLSPYNYADSLNWNKQAVEQITKRLVALNRPYKYIVNSSLLQIGSGTGMNVSTISYWNKATDLSWQYRWETKNILVVVYVYALATS
ncbi:Tctex-1 family protein [Ostertagia ostertagi]